jgi:hypothetical protein
MRSSLQCGLTTVAQPVAELIPKRNVAENADFADVNRRVFLVSFLPSYTLFVISSLL